LESEEAVQDIPETVSARGGFAPLGWVIETRSLGRIDADAIEDLVLQLIQKERPDAPPNTRNRILVVALGKAEGGYRRVGVGAHILQCTTRGGAFYIGNAQPSNVEIEKRSVVVTQDSGSREVPTQTWKLRCDPDCARLPLYQEIVGARDRVEGTSSSTETDWGPNKATIRSYRASTPGGRERLVSTRTRASQGPVYLEDIDDSSR
jgi:hypothetical protein